MKIAICAEISRELLMCQTTTTRFKFADTRNTRADTKKNCEIPRKRSQHPLWSMNFSCEKALKNVREPFSTCFFFPSTTSTASRSSSSCAAVSNQHDAWKNLSEGAAKFLTKISSGFRVMFHVAWRELSHQVWSHTLLANDSPDGSEILRNSHASESLCAVLKTFQFLSTSFTFN